MRVCTGRRSWPRQRSAQCWLILPIDHWESVTPADRFCCFFVYWRPWGFGVGRRVRSRSSTVSTPKVEAFYWATITFSQTLGTALGDWLADTGGLGYERGALVFAAGLLAVVALYYWTGVSRVALFWVAFILTRPLGATVGDFVDKPIADGGLALSRPLASAVIAAIIIALLIILPQRAGRHPAAANGDTAAGEQSASGD